MDENNKKLGYSPDIDYEEDYSTDYNSFLYNYESDEDVFNNMLSYDDDFMNDIQNNIDNLVTEKDKSWSATGQKQDEYNAFKGTMSSYDEVYTQSKSEFGIEEHRENYEKSKKALALAESTLSALPSSINSSSNRVLTQSQREARYNALSNRAMAYRDNLLARSSAYEEVWKKAREEQATYAKAEIASQYGKLGDYNNAFVNAMNEYDQAAKRLTEARVEKLNWESDYRNWQFNQWQNAETIWFNNLNAALDRYVQALNTELTMKQAEITKRRADTNARLANLNDSMADTLVAYHWYQQAGK
jgi:hypothetical protein